MASLTDPPEAEQPLPSEVHPAARAPDSHRSLIERTDVAHAVLLLGGVILLVSGWQLLASRGPTSADTVTRPLEFEADFNTAPASELSLLPGIGPEMAKRIIVEREAGGPFRSLDDLARVRGIGPKTIRQIESMVRFGPTPTAD